MGWRLHLRAGKAVGGILVAILEEKCRTLRAEIVEGVPTELCVISAAL